MQTYDSLKSHINNSIDKLGFYFLLFGESILNWTWASLNNIEKNFILEGLQKE